MPRNYFDGRVAARYDDDSMAMFAPSAVDPIVDVLEALADGRPALEFGVGTGRIALPLHRRGVRVHGIDLSPHMIERLRAKPGGDELEVTEGDFSSARVAGSFGLVYLVFNTVMNLTTQEEQVSCFLNAAAHLDGGGYFVVETMVPDLRRLPPGEHVRAFSVTQTHFGFDSYDVATQSLVSHHYRIDGGRLDVFSAPFRFVWPSELDLMARIAGLTLAERWADWTRAPFTDESTHHVSVWQKT